MDLVDCALTESFNLFSMPTFPINWKPNLEVSSDSSLPFKAERLCISAVFFLLYYIGRHNVRLSSFSDTKLIQCIQLVSVHYKVPQ